MWLNLILLTNLLLALHYLIHCKNIDNLDRYGANWTSPQFKDLLQENHNLHLFQAFPPQTIYKDPSCISKPTLYYLSTSEGIMSHYEKLRQLWHISRSVDKCLTIFAFRSEHFSFTLTSMCDYFQFPNDVACLKYDYPYYRSLDLTQNLTCIIPSITPKISYWYDR